MMLEQKKPYANLDRLLNPGAVFTLHRIDYEIPPIEQKVFMAFFNAWYELQQRIAQKTITLEESKSVSLKIIQSVIPAFTVELMDSMTLAQLGALVEFIIRVVTGDRLDADEIKKKVFGYLDPMAPNSQASTP